MKTSLDDRLYAALQGDMTPKFLATKDEQDIPNVVPIISIQPYDRQTLIFGNFLMAKTEQNLKKSPLVSVTVITEELFGATIKGVFEGFQRVGEYTDLVNASRHMRYNAYMGVRSAGSIRVVEISDSFQLSRLSVLSGNLRSKMLKGRGRRYTQGRQILHPLVSEKYGRFVAVKVLSYIDDEGYPYAFPALSLQPAAPDVMIFRKMPKVHDMGSLRDDAEVAASVITMEPVAFQVKGVYKDLDPRWGAIRLNRAYHASPPLVGKQIA